MDDAMREYMEAKAEHERALAAVSAVCEQLEHVRTEYTDAQRAEQQTEQELQRAVALVAAGLQELQVSENATASTPDARPAAASDADADTAAQPDSSDSVTSPATQPVAHDAPVDHASSDGQTDALPPPLQERPVIVDSLVEYHRNIGCYHCYLFLDTSASDSSTTAYGRVDANQLSVRVAFPRIELHHAANEQVGTITTSDTLWWATEIERMVEPSHCVVTIKQDHIHLRLPIRDSDKDVSSSDTFSSFSHVTARELNPQHYRRIACRACSNELLQPFASDATAESPQPTIERVLPLPSANWTDMFDFWGAGLGAFEHLPREDIRAQRSRVFVGESHVLLHADDTIDIALVAVVAPQTAADDSESLACSCCAAVLGKRDRDDAATIRLDKHMLTAAGGAEEEEKDVFARYTVDSVVSAKLLEIADSDGVFRFTLQSIDDEEEAIARGQEETAALVLQLLSWETQVKAAGARSFHRVLKVLFAPMPRLLTDDDNNSSATVEQTVGASAARALVFPRAVCDAVALRLDASAQHLPLSLRTFNNMRVGYLYA